MINFNYLSSAASSKVSTALRALSLETNELPVYEPLSEASKKERTRAKFAENAVHIIPLVLLLCAFILWVFSNPDINLQTKGNSGAAKIEGLTIEGDVDSDGTSNGKFTPRVGRSGFSKTRRWPSQSFYFREGITMTMLVFFNTNFFAYHF